ncbi:MAG: hypothetical protein CUN55_02255, partial [Phototrophicales bacterium]
MLRRMGLVVLTVIALSLGSISTIDAQDSGEQSIYTTSDGTFQFSYPPTWASNSTTSGEVILAPTEDILNKNLTEFTSGDMSFQVLSPLFTARFANTEAAAPVDVLSAVQQRLGANFLVENAVTEVRFGDYPAARLDLTAEGLDVIVVAVGLDEAVNSLIFGFAPRGERENLLAPISEIASSMRYTPPIIEEGQYPSITISNATELENIVIWGGHNSGIRNIAFSPDGQQIASVDNTSIVIVRNVNNGDEVFRLVSERIISAGPAFSPDGRFLLFGSPNGTVWQWNIVENRLEGEWGPMGGTVWDVAYSPDGTTIAAASADLTVRIWLATENVPIAILTGHRNDVVSVVYDESGQQIVSASLDGTARLWDIKTAEGIITLLGPVQGVTSAAITPNGKLIAGGGVTGTVHVWDVATQQERYNFA